MADGASLLHYVLNCLLSIYCITIMTRFSTATIAILLSSANSTSAFTPSQLPVFRSIYSPSAIANEDTDFDAPITTSAKPIELDHEIVVVDDECYLGKYGQYDECVDFGKFVHIMCHLLLCSISLRFELCL